VNRVKFGWVVASTDADAHVKELSRAGGENISVASYTATDQESAHSAFAPLVILVGVIAVSYLVDKIIQWVTEAGHHGLIVDVRGGALNIRESASLGRNVVIVVTENGVQKFESADHHESEVLAALKAVVGK
jgi:hypothetical protein